MLGLNLKHQSAVAGVVTLAATLAGPVAAQNAAGPRLEEPDILIRTFERTLEEGQERAEFRLPITADTAIEILVPEALDPRLDPVVEVVSANGSLMVRDDDGGPGMSAFARVYSERAQDLVVRISQSSGGTASSAMPFEIQVRPSDYRPPKVEDFQRLLLGAPDRTIPSGEGSEFVFSGAAGDIWVFDLVSEEGTADPILQVFDFQGTGSTPVAGDDDGGDGLNSRLAFRLPSSGNFRIKAGSLNQGEGAMTLKVSKPVEKVVQDTQMIGVNDTQSAEIAAYSSVGGEEPFVEYRLSDAAWAALSSGQGVIDLKRQDGGEGDPLLEVGLRSSLGFAVIDSNDDIGAGNVDARLLVNFGALTEEERKSFRIRAKGSFGSSGTFDLTVTAAE
ncbi:hypothetical protein GCM10022213_08930 [Parerythrobacter jejuensis]